MNYRILVAAMLTSAVSLCYAGNPSLEVKNHPGSPTYNVTYKNDKKCNVKFIVRDENGKLLLMDKLQNVSSFAIPVSFEDKLTGKFTICVDNGQTVVEKQIEVTQNSKIVTRVTKLSENRYVVSAAGGHDQKLLIRVYDPQGNLRAFEERITEGSLSVLFNTKNIEGTPTFVVSDLTGKSEIVECME